MSCFWQGIAKALSKAELVALDFVSRPTPRQLVRALKRLNRRTPDITCQGSRLTEQQQDENYSHVQQLRESDTSNGYMTAACDPVLVLAAQLFLWNIVFIYDGHKIALTHFKPFRHIKFKATRSHFEFVSSSPKH